MKNSRYFLLSISLLLTLFTPLQVMSQADDTSHPTMREFAQYMLSLKSMSARVECKIENQMTGITSSYTARIEARERAFFLEGMGMEIYSDGVTRWQYLPDANEVTISEINPSETNPMEQPLEIFRHYEKQFKVRFRGERIDKGVAYYDFTLYPRSLSTDFSQIHLTITKQGLAPHQMTYQGKDGVIYLINIQEFKPNAKVRTSFQFDPTQHKGVEVIDLRK